MEKNINKTEGGLIGQIGFGVAIFYIILCLGNYIFSPKDKSSSAEYQIQDMYDYHKSEGRNVLYDGETFRVILE